MHFCWTCNERVPSGTRMLGCELCEGWAVTVGEHVAQETLRKREIAKLKTRYAKAVTAAQRAAEARRALPPGSSRARVTTANARWAAAAEYRDMLADQLRELGEDV